MPNLAEMIKSDVIKELTWDARVQSENIKVQVPDPGIVILSGEVPSVRTRTRAVFDAWTVKGVKAVDNQIKVNLKSGLDYPTDSVIKRRIVQLLSYDLTLDSSRIEVSVINGVASLNGTVETYWEIEYVEELVSSLDGIIEIFNDLSVVPTKKVSDEIIARQITDSIKRSIAVSNEEIDVLVSDANVILTGKVPDRSAYLVAEKAAKNTFGVIDVSNQIKIES